MDLSSARGRGAAGGLLFAMSSRCRASQGVALIVRPIATDSLHRSVPNAQLPAKLPIPDYSYSSSRSSRRRPGADKVCRSESFGHHTAGSAFLHRAAVSTVPRSTSAISPQRPFESDERKAYVQEIAQESLEIRDNDMACRVPPIVALERLPLRPSVSSQRGPRISTMEPFPRLG